MRRSNRIPHHSRAVLSTLTRILGLTVAFALAFAGPAHADLLWPKAGGSPNADRIQTLYIIVFALALIIFVAVMAALIYALVKFRDRPGAVAVQSHGNVRLEIGLTAAAAGIVLVIGIVSFIMLPGIRNPENSDADGLKIEQAALPSKDSKLLPPDGNALNIDVNGQQYAWRFVYPDGDGDHQNNVTAYEEMVVPTGTTVTLDIRSSDVAHSWWIPELGGKLDAIPGYTNHTWFKIPSKVLRNDEERRNGRVFVGQCAELCGRNHGNMTARVRALPPERYQEWLRRQRADTEEAAAARQRYREEQSRSDATPDAEDAQASTSAPEDSETTDAPQR
ncbi:MAG: cytochrome c oxidase subunit II [Solirubrobacteraceae bacterium]|nr:cytochrome c oxidase subunit II [Solirubrobacteraceae bacterium]